MTSAPLPTEPVLERAVRGYRTTLVSQAIRLLCKVASVVVLARLVSPADHGRFAMASSIFACLALFRDVGLATATVQTRDLSAVQLDTLFWAHLSLGFILTLIGLGLAPVAAQFYGTAAVAPLLMTMSIAFLFIGAGGFVRSQLYRQLHFDRANRLETIAAVTGTVAMILAGLAGAGAYAFVIFLLVSEGVATALAWKAQDWRPTRRPAWDSLRGLLRTGRDVTVHQGLGYALQQLDTIAIGHWFGAYPLGLYNRANQLLALPSFFVVGPLGQIMLATLSRLRPDSPEFGRHAWSTVTAIGHFVLPLFAVCIVLPAETVRLVLGPQWPEAAPLVRVLAIGGVAAAISSLSYAINVALGRTIRLVGAAAVTLPFTALAIWVGARHGVLGIATGIAVVNVLIAVPRLAWLLRDLPDGFRGFCAALIGPLCVMGVAIIGLGCASGLLSENTHWAVRLSSAIAGGAAAVGLAVLVSPTLRRQFSAAFKILPSRTSFTDKPS
jgi:PST family polysaccharide transporter